MILTSSAARLEEVVSDEGERDDGGRLKVTVTVRRVPREKRANTVYNMAVRSHRCG